MKNILLITLLIALPMAVFSQNRALNKFYRQHKKESVMNAKVPGWLIRLGGKFMKNKMESPEEKMAIDLLKDFGPVRFMHTEDGEGIPKEDIQNLRQNLLNSEFDDLIMVRSGEMDFQLMIKENGQSIENIVMIYNDREGGEMTNISAKTNISYEALQMLVKTAMKEKLEPIWEEEEEVVEPVMQL